MTWRSDKSHLRPRIVTIMTIGTAARTVMANLRFLLDGVDEIDRVSVAMFDADATNGHGHTARPLVESDRQVCWSPHTFVHLPLPGHDFLESILRGERRGLYDNIPPEIFRTVKGNGMVGAGGLVPAASGSATLNEKRVRGAVRKLFNRITDYRNESNEDADTPLLLVTVFSCLGAMWGAEHRIYDLALEEARRMGLNVSSLPIVMYPGVHASRDMQASMANAAAWTEEFSARATRRYFQPHVNTETGEHELRVAHAVPSFVVADMNNAPGQTSSVSTEALFSQVAQVLKLITATPFGEQLQADLIDYEDDAFEVDGYGERRLARSFGCSFITLDRERVLRFSAQRLKQTAIDQLYALVDEPDIQTDVRRFYRLNRLRQGVGFNDLRRALSIAGDGGVDHATRFRYLLDDALRGLEGMDLLRAAPNVVATTISQTADSTEAIRSARRELSRSVRAAVDDHLREWIWNAERGVNSAAQWLAAASAIADNARHFVVEDLRRHEEELEALEANVRQIEEEAIPRFSEMGRIKRFFNRKQVDELASRYVQLVKALVSRRRENEAEQEALRVFSQMKDYFDARYEELTQLTDELTLARDAAEDEEARIRGWDGTLVNPKGFALDDDLDGLYRQILTRPDESDDVDVESRAAQELLQALRGRGDLLQMASEPGRIADEMDRIALQKVATAVESLHVQTELLRRYPLETPELRSFLRERDREAFENITLTGVAQHDSGEQVLRYICGASVHGLQLRDELNTESYQREQGNAIYQLINTVDPEQLVLVQVRLSFPPRQIGMYPVCKEAKAERSKNLRFEKMHTELVGRFLPEPRATEHEAQVALVKALAIGALTKSGRVESAQFSFSALQGESVPVDARLRSLRDYGVRVEITTRFYCKWRLDGPEAVRTPVLELKRSRETARASEDDVIKMVADLVDDDSIQHILDELAWYDRNTLPQASWWGAEE